MDTQNADCTSVSFSTATLPERQRVPAWRDFWGRTLFGAEFEPAPDVQFRVDVAARRLPGVDLLSSYFSAGRVLRTPALAADGSDGIGLIISASETTSLQGGREITSGAGDAVIMTTADASVFTSHSSGPVRCVHLSRAALMPLVSRDDGFVRSVPRSNEALRYLLSYLRFLGEEWPPADPRLAEAAAAHVRDLVALVLGANREGAVLAHGRGLRASRLHAMKRYVARSAQDARLTVGAVAARFGVTPRYVQRLFESEGATFSKFLLEERLAHARRMLSDPTCHGWAVSAIAYEAGFSDISYFNRCFRRRYGASPTELRPRDFG
jgi:AraC-like DNA-binding protein